MLHVRNVYDGLCGGQPQGDPPMDNMALFGGSLNDSESNRLTTGSQGSDN